MSVAYNRVAADEVTRHKQLDEAEARERAWEAAHDAAPSYLAGLKGWEIDDWLNHAEDNSGVAALQTLLSEVAKMGAVTGPGADYRQTRVVIAAKALAYTMIKMRQDEVSK